MPSPPHPVVDNRLLEGFGRWLGGRVSEDTAEYYVNVVRAGEWPPGKGKHVKAWRKYVHYLFSIGALSWEQYQAYLLYLKTTGVARHSTVEAVPHQTILQYRIYWSRPGWVHCTCCCLAALGLNTY